MPFAFLSELQRKACTFHALSSGRNTHLNKHLVQFRAVFFCSRRSSCLWPTEFFWSCNLVFDAYIQHGPTDGRTCACAVRIDSGQGHHGPERRANLEQRGANRVARWQDRCYGWTIDGIQERCPKHPTSDVVEKQEDYWSYGDCSISELLTQVIARRALTTHSSWSGCLPPSFVVPDWINVAIVCHNSTSSNEDTFCYVMVALVNFLFSRAYACLSALRVRNVMLSPKTSYFDPT